LTLPVVKISGGVGEISKPIVEALPHDRNSSIHLWSSAAGAERGVLIKKKEKKVHG